MKNHTSIKTTTSGNHILKEMMTFNKLKKKVEPLFVAEINGTFIIAAYQGALSEFDVLIKYRQKHSGKWSRIRTPKHIHWAVDILIKMHEEPDKTKEFLSYLLEVWENTVPLKDEDARKKILDINFLIKENEESFNKYKDLSKKGEYSIKFLILLAKLLMIQEKTNLETAYRFRNLINALKEGKDIFKIVSIATHNRR